MPDGSPPPLAQPRETVRRIFENQNVIKKLQAAVPRHLNPDRMLRVLSLAIQKTPELGECEAMSLLGAMMVCASLGLEPNTPLGHCYLIPFKRREKRGNQWVDAGVDVNLIIGYRGYVDLARRSGTLVSLHADVVYGAAEGRKADEFSFEYGSGMHLRHVPVGDNEGRPPIWAYAHASLTDGQAFEVLPFERVLKIRDASQGYQAALRAKSQYGAEARAYVSAPWVAFEHEMAAKTMVRRLAKMLPLSIEFAAAADIDSRGEAGRVNLAEFADGVDVGMIDISAEREPASEPAAQIEQSKEQPLDTGVPQEQREAEAVTASGAGSGAGPQQAQAGGAQPGPAAQQTGAAAQQRREEPAAETRAAGQSQPQAAKAGPRKELFD